MYYALESIVTDPAIQELINRQDEMEGRQEALLHRVQPVLEYAEPIARAEAKKRQREAVEREIEGEGKAIVPAKRRRESLSLQGAVAGAITAAYALYLAVTAETVSIEAVGAAGGTLAAALTALRGAWRREDLK